MKLKVTLFLFFIIFHINSQNKNNWFLLVESGFSEVNSRIKPHFGIGAEYFISKTRSFSIRIKYFKNSIDYTGGLDFFSGGDLCEPTGLVCLSSKRLLYEGSVLKIPVNYKWEYQIFNSKINFFMNGGIAFNFTVDENFVEINDFIPDEKKFNINFNFGLGLSYNLKSNLNIYSAYEIFSGNPKTKKEGSFLESKRYTREVLLNLGLRYKLQ